MGDLFSQTHSVGICSHREIDKYQLPITPVPKIGDDAPYDKRRKESLLKYASKLKGKTLKESIMEMGFEIPDGLPEGKGKFDAVLENLYFRIMPGNESEPDFEELSIELKTAPMRQISNNKYRSKDPMILNIIDYMQLSGLGFKGSVLHNAKEFLIVFYLDLGEPDVLDKEILDCILWKVPSEDMAMIKGDWDIINNKVKEGHAHEISRGDTWYLEATLKGSGGEERIQSNSEILSNQLAFALKASYMNSIWEPLNEEESFFEGMFQIGGPNDLEETILRKLEHYKGKSVFDLLDFFHMPFNPSDKGQHARLARRMILDGEKKIAEFEKAGIVIKTVRLGPRGVPSEDMSFKAFDYNSIVAQGTWEESEFCETLDSKFLFMVFQHDRGESTYFKAAKFWNMPKEDLVEAGKEWALARDRILNNDLDKILLASEGRILFVRAHARDSKDVQTVGDGEKSAVKKSFWINRYYIKEVLKEQDDEKIPDNNKKGFASTELISVNPIEKTQSSNKKDKTPNNKYELEERTKRWLDQACIEGLYVTKVTPNLYGIQKAAKILWEVAINKKVHIRNEFWEYLNDEWSAYAIRHVVHNNLIGKDELIELAIKQVSASVDRERVLLTKTGRLAYVILDMLVKGEGLGKELTNMNEIHHVEPTPVERPEQIVEILPRNSLSDGEIKDIVLRKMDESDAPMSIPEIRNALPHDLRIDVSEMINSMIESGVLEFSSLGVRKKHEESDAGQECQYVPKSIEGSKEQLSGNPYKVEPEQSISDAIPVEKRNQLIIDGKLNVNSVPSDILRYLLESSGNAVLLLSHLVSRYKRFLSALNNTDDSKFNINVSEIKQILNGSDYALMIGDDQVLFFNMERSDIEKLIDALRLESYQNLLISAEKIFVKNIRLLIKNRLNDANALYYFLKKNEGLIKCHVKFCKAPMLMFGRNKVENKCGSAEAEGHKPSEDDDHTHDEVPLIDAGDKHDKTVGEAIEAPDIMILEKDMNKEWYTMDEVSFIFRNALGESTAEDLNRKNLSKIGYKMAKGYVYQAKYKTPYEAFCHFLSRAEGPTKVDEDERKIQLLGKAIRDMCRAGELFPIYPDSYVSIAYLGSKGIGSNVLNDYLDAVCEFEEDGEYFTLSSMRKKGFTHRLEELGFDDIFYDFLIGNDKRIRSIRWAKVDIYKKTRSEVSVSDLVDTILYGKGSMHAFDVIDVLRDRYGINVYLSQVLIGIDASKEKNRVYYDKVTERIYSTKDDYYKEMGICTTF